MDAQGARPLPTINTAYVTNALWAGTFGSFGVNEGTESVWNQDTLVAINHDGLMGLEANNNRALIVHRQVINKAVTDSLGYTAMFDAAFPEIPENLRYTRRVAAFALAAYFRTILTNQAPFQNWLKGDESAMFRLYTWETAYNIGKDRFPLSGGFEWQGREMNRRYGRYAGRSSPS